MYLETITKGETDHLLSYHLGWRIIRCEAEVPDGMRIFDLTNDSRIIKAYRSSGSVSCRSFLEKISKGPMRNIGIKSLKVLAESLHEVLSGEKVAKPDELDRHRCGRYLLNFGKITKDQQIHLDRYCLGWNILRGVTQAPVAIKIFDITKNVRIINAYRALGCRSLGEFIEKATSTHTRNLAHKSFKILAEALHAVVSGEKVVKSAGSDKNYSNGGFLALMVLYADIQTLRHDFILEDSTVRAWFEKVNYGQHGRLFISEILSKAYSKPQTVLPEIPLLDAVDRRGGLDALLGEIDNEIVWIIRAIAWLANEATLGRLDELINSAPDFSSRALGIINSKNLDILDVMQDDWDLWWGIVHLRDARKYTMAKIAVESGLDWQTNELSETIGAYYEKSPSMLLGRRSIGKKKFLRITKMLAYLAVKGCAESETSIDPWKAVEVLNLNSRNLRVIKIRYGGDSVPTLDMCGKQFGITRERIRQIEAKVASAANYSGLNKRAIIWLEENALDIWQQLSRDGGVTVDAIDESPVALRRKLNADCRLIFLLSGLEVIDFLGRVGIKTEFGWQSKTRGVEAIKIKLSGRHKIVNI
jgi:hypothetical protein